MATHKLYHDLESAHQYFLGHYSDEDFSEGWKLSIQGKTVQDVMYLYDTLKGLLYETNVSFKMATKKLIDLNNEQSTKLMTIYIPNGIDVKMFAELIHRKIKDYKGWEGITHKESYEHYKGGIFFRNDRDANGEYIPAKQLTK